MTGTGIVLALLYMWTALTIFAYIARYRHPEKVKPLSAGSVTFGIIVAIGLAVAYTYLAVA